jgi:predicted dehydrogenase
MEALKSVLAQGTVGELRVARAEFGLKLTNVPRAIDAAQAGGSLLDLGVYCVQFISMVFGRQRPEKISAVGKFYETGTPALAWPTPEPRTYLPAHENQGRTSQRKSGRIRDQSQEHK